MPGWYLKEIHNLYQHCPCLRNPLNRVEHKAMLIRQELSPKHGKRNPLKPEQYIDVSMVYFIILCFTLLLQVFLKIQAVGFLLPCIHCTYINHGNPKCYILIIFVHATVHHFNCKLRVFLALTQVYIFNWFLCTKSLQC